MDWAQRSLRQLYKRKAPVSALWGEVSSGDNRGTVEGGPLGTELFPLRMQSCPVGIHFFPLGSTPSPLYSFLHWQLCHSSKAGSDEGGKDVTNTEMCVVALKNKGLRCLSAEAWTPLGLLTLSRQ